MVVEKASLMRALQGVIPFQALKAWFLREVMGGVHPTLRIPTKIAVTVGFHPKSTLDAIFWPNIDIRPYL